MTVLSAVMSFASLAATPALAQPSESTLEESADQIDVRVRLVVFTRLGMDSCTRLRQEVDRIWTPLGVRVWWDLSGPNREGPDRREAPSDVTVLVLDDGSWPNPGRSPEALAQGTLYTPPRGRPSAVVLTSTDRARRLVSDRARSREHPPVLAERLLPLVLGRAIAHEIGHYLLGSSSHSREGLMRRSFTPDDVLLTNSSFPLEPQQILTLKARWSRGDRAP
jgi:hypothetical protein